jgi:hypothetical protein
VHDPWTKSTIFFNSRINSEIGYFRNFAKRPLGFFEIDPQSLVFAKRPLGFEK